MHSSWINKANNKQNCMNIFDLFLIISINNCIDVNKNNRLRIKKDNKPGKLIVFICGQLQYQAMVYIPRITFKSGINPSLIAWFPTDGKFSGTQKLMLTRTRIFGDKISGNLPSGMKIWRKTYPARFQYLAKSTLQMHDAERDLPGLTKLKHEGWDNLYYRQIYREQKKIQKEAKLAAKQTKKKK